MRDFYMEPVAAIQGVRFFEAAIPGSRPPRCTLLIPMGEGQAVWLSSQLSFVPETNQLVPTTVKIKCHSALLFVFVIGLRPYELNVGEEE